MERYFCNKHSNLILSEKKYVAMLRTYYGGIYSYLSKKNNLYFVGQTFDEFFYAEVEVNGIEFAHDDWYLIDEDETLFLLENNYI